MTEIPKLERLPLGFRFHPTDEELINHYLKRKIRGRIEPGDDVIPEIDVCKCEPWDLPDKSLIKSDDPEWFFFAPKDRKYPNGLRSKRATEAGYWKATGKDRVIRSKATVLAEKRDVIGMKKTLVFHRGRAPNGARTNWIIHEYRTTEPEFESGDQGGYVLYRLFKKPEETSSNSNIEETVAGDCSPTSKKYSPDNFQHGTVDLEENGTPLNHHSPKSDSQEQPVSPMDPFEKKPESIMKQIEDMADHSTTYSMQPDVSHCHLALQEKEESKAREKDVLAHFSNLEYQQTESSYFPDVSSPMLPYTDYPFFGNINNGLVPVVRAEQDSLHDLLNLMLKEEESVSATATFENDSFGENLVRHRLLDSPSVRNNIGLASDLDTTVGLAQRPADAESFDWLDGTFSLSNILEPQLDTGNESLNLHGSIKTQVHSISSYIHPSQDMFGNIDNSNSQKNIAGSSNNLEGIGIEIRSRGSDVLPNSDVLQGTTTRRMRLASAVLFPSVDSESSTTIYDHEKQQKPTNVLELVCEDVDGSARKEGKLLNNRTGKSVKAWHHLNSKKSLSQYHYSAIRIVLRRKCKVRLFSCLNSKSRSSSNHVQEVTIMQKGVPANDITSEVQQSLSCSFPDKPVRFSAHDRTPYISDVYKRTSKAVTRLTVDHNCLEIDSSFQQKAPRSHSVALYLIWLTVMVVLVPLCLDLWGRIVYL
ncbi:NAC domain-containing protein 14-like [Zingiber officinale]|uniref:NAC domain-containing protein n=1 Tax=Zingiber officinale TaxID=94328 RepID=A0A8J5LZY6_ZINOF|nr:NAC domain-containing protein 14-like [Zingiber officinale]KAG6538531.1 hypothetical protein ZIOFF_003655 [Zingiber officinale]